MHSFKNRIIPFAQRPRVKLLQSLTHEIYGLALLRIPAHLVHGISQHIRQRTRSRRRLRRIFHDVLSDRPQIQHRPPIHITHVARHTMGLMRAHQRIVPRKTRIPLALPITSFQCKPFKQHPQSVWKTVTAEGTLLGATRARMHTQDRARLRVAIVSTGCHHNLRDEAPDLR